MTNPAPALRLPAADACSRRQGSGSTLPRLSDLRPQRRREALFAVARTRKPGERFVQPVEDARYSPAPEHSEASHILARAVES
jgi:hypothetical protein